MGELPMGFYEVRQGIGEDGELETTVVPIRKRWWWFGSTPRDETRLELLREMEKAGTE